VRRRAPRERATLSDVNPEPPADPAVPQPSRRQVLAWLAAAGAAGLAGCRARPGAGGPASEGPRAASAEAQRAMAALGPARMPVGFVGHGAPTTALDERKGGDWARWARAIPKPKSILVVSAHWEEAPLTIGATTAIPLVYDFYGFPDEMYALRYPSPGAPALADRVEALLRGRVKTQRDPERGLDHGTWVPLLKMWPEADVPVLQVSIPSHKAPALYEVGRALAPLRDEGVFLLGSGNVTHNLGRIGGRATPAWAGDFDAWIEDATRRKDLDALADWQRKAPGAAMAHPTVEHFVPLLFAAAAADTGGDTSFPVSGFEGGSISRRCVQFG
jgi:4,5-DOPA dioxygenase extradiol